MPQQTQKIVFAVFVSLVFGKLCDWQEGWKLLESSEKQSSVDSYRSTIL